MKAYIFPGQGAQYSGMGLDLSSANRNQIVKLQLTKDAPGDLLLVHDGVSGELPRLEQIDFVQVQRAHSICDDLLLLLGEHEPSREARRSAHAPQRGTFAQLWRVKTRGQHAAAGKSLWIAICNPATISLALSL